MAVEVLAKGIITSRPLLSGGSWTEKDMKIVSSEEVRILETAEEMNMPASTAGETAGEQVCRCSLPPRVPFSAL